MAFVDRLHLQLASGRGGAGKIHFHRTRSSARAGPDGGDGGRGGDLIFFPKSSLLDFSHLKNQIVYRARNGEPGGARKKKGAKGKDLLIPVPQGTFFYSCEGEFLKELKEKSWTFLNGGRGGKGNGFFKNSRLQAPRKAQRGEDFSQETVILELKWSSDIALIGMRGGGKTSLMWALSKKKEKEKTKPSPSSKPQFFSIKNQDPSKNPILFVDLPGISRSTLKFLKQAERTKNIFFVLSLEDEDSFLTYQKLRDHLFYYDKKNKSFLSTKPTSLVFMGRKELLPFSAKDLFQRENIIKKMLFFEPNQFIKSGKFTDEVFALIQKSC